MQPTEQRGSWKIFPTKCPKCGVQVEIKEVRVKEGI
jgi:rRNA maturation endonuclease Nob1